MKRQDPKEIRKAYEIARKELAGLFEREFSPFFVETMLVRYGWGDFIRADRILASLGAEDSSSLEGLVFEQPGKLPVNADSETVDRLFSDRLQKMAGKFQERQTRELLSQADRKPEYYDIATELAARMAETGYPMPAELGKFVAEILRKERKRPSQRGPLKSEEGHRRFRMACAVYRIVDETSLRATRSPASDSNEVMSACDVVSKVTREMGKGYAYETIRKEAWLPWSKEGRRGRAWRASDQEKAGR
jgi:hypothetical protein